MPYEFMCSNVGCGQLGPDGRCKVCGWPMRALQRVSVRSGAEDPSRVSALSNRVRVPESESSDPEFDADPDDGGD